MSITIASGRDVCLVACRGRTGADDDDDDVRAAAAAAGGGTTSINHGQQQQQQQPQQRYRPAPRQASSAARHTARHTRALRDSDSQSTRHRLRAAAAAFWRYTSR